MVSENYDIIQKIALNDVETLKSKGENYGSSWRNRGGVGAFMMMARKWDRIENICKKGHYDIFDAAKRDIGHILDDISDLRAYLLLIEGHVRSATPYNAAQCPHGYDRTVTCPYCSFPSSAASA